MKLARVSIERYRSIRQTARLDLGSRVVLVGPNNEGKSNILRAIVIGMRILRRFALTSRSTQVANNRISLSASSGYEWTDDYPKDLQEKTPGGSTIIDLWFELDEIERDSFKKAVGVGLRTELAIRIKLYRRNAEITIRKQGPSAQALTNKAAVIARYIGQNIRVDYIQSVRTAADAARVVRDMLQLQFEEILEQDEYRDALTTLREALRPALEPLSRELAETLSAFLPDVRNVEVSVPFDDLAHTLASKARILVDDGAVTDLSMKGDGIQSLAALALVRESANVGRSALFLGLEEPEAHLHPRAIHQVRQVLYEIGAKQQVAVTTHSPILVDRFDLANNIIVQGNKARPANSLAELRDALGVRASDNLMSASLVLLVEGECDHVSLKSIIASVNPSLGTLIDDGTMAIEFLRSASNLLPRLETLRSQICRYVVLLDHDSAGQEVAAKARAEDLLRPVEEYFTIVQGMRESEFEDCLDPACYIDVVKRAFGVELQGRQFDHSRAKWSSRVEACFRSEGKHFDKSTKRAIKIAVAQAAGANPERALHSQRSTALIALIRVLAESLKNMGAQTT